MLDLYVDIDACPVYREVAEAASLHRLDLYVVTRGFVVVPAEAMVHPVLAEDDDGSGDDWIASNIADGDICITPKAALAAHCLLRGARAMAPGGTVWSMDGLARGLGIGNLHELPAKLGQSKAREADRAHFARQLETLIAALRRDAQAPRARRSADDGCVEIRRKTAPAMPWRAAS
jgi:uncharacterized protein YaiI (UPF0178 family)